MIKIIIAIFIKLVCSIILAALIHEASHSIMARIHKKRIKFKFTFGKLFNKIPIPRWIWQMPSGLNREQVKHIAYAGFQGEFLLLVIMFLIPITRYEFAPYYGIVSVIHILLYPWYAGDYSDFKVIETYNYNP